jgi:hypothetical protein
MSSVRYKIVEVGDCFQEIEIHKVTVHSFIMGDVDDPDLYAAVPMLKWEKSEPGKFVMENAVDTPEWRRRIDNTSYGYQYIIVAELEKKKLSEFYLRWGKYGDSKIR